jgi:PilZ domain
MSPQLLTADERHALVAVLQELDPSAPREQRQNLRHKVLVQTEVRVLVKGGTRSPQKLAITNVSKNGAAILREQPLEIGDKFSLRLEFGEGGGWQVLCEVRNCRKLASGVYKIGGRFVDRIEDPRNTGKIPGDWLAYAK